MPVEKRKLEGTREAVLWGSDIKAENCPTMLYRAPSISIMVPLGVPLAQHFSVSHILSNPLILCITSCLTH